MPLQDSPVETLFVTVASPRVLKRREFVDFSASANLGTIISPTSTGLAPNVASPSNRESFEASTIPNHNIEASSVPRQESLVESPATKPPDRPVVRPPESIAPSSAAKPPKPPSPQLQIAELDRKKLVSPEVQYSKPPTEKDLIMKDPYATDSRGEAWTSDKILDCPMGTHIGAPTGPDEDARLEALHAYKILDTEPDDSVFNRYTKLVAERMGTEICLISLVSNDVFPFFSLNFFGGLRWIKIASGLNQDMDFRCQKRAEIWPSVLGRFCL